MSSNRRSPDGSWTRLTVAAAGLSGAVGVLALVGWLTGSERLMAIEAGRIPMAPSTAALFMLFGALAAADTARRIRRSVLLVSIAAGTAVAGVLLLLSLAGITSPLEHLGLEITGEVAGAPIGHMSPVTALAFVLAGAAFLLAMAGSERWRRVGFMAAVLLEVMAVTLVIAYLLSRPVLYHSGVIPPALNTSLGFVLLGVAMLGAAARRVWRRGEADVAPQPEPAYGLLGILAVAVLVVGTAAVTLYEDYETGVRNEVEEQLLTVAELKVGQIEAWRRERVSDASTFHRNVVFAELIAEAMYGGSAQAGRQLESWLEPFRRAYQYKRVAVVDSTGRTRISVPRSGPNATDAPHSMPQTAEVLRAGEIGFEGFHRDSPDGPIHLSVVAPVLDADSTVVGGVVLRVDPATYLYPLLMRWPTPTRTAETLLVRRDGDDVLFLNDLRFHEDAALSFRIPLSDRDLPATRAVFGEEGIVEGVDYRGERVVAAVQPVPGSDWKLVARVDIDEVYGALRQRLGLTVALVALVLAGVVTAIGFLWQRREKLHYRDLARTERRHSTLLDSIGDGVIATDAQGRVELMNPVAETLTGWTEEDALGRPLDRVFTIVNEATREPVESPVAKVIREGAVVDLANSTVLIARDGTERPIADSGAPVREQDGSLSGIVLVFRDRTEQQRARQRLEEEVQRSQQYLDVAGVMIVVLDREGRVQVVNRQGEELLGYPEDEIVGKDWFEHFIPENQRETVRQVHEKTLAGEATYPREFENEVLTRDGEERTIQWRNAVVRDEDGAIDRTISSGLDVTERRRAQEAVRRNEARYRNLVNSIRDAILVADTDRKIIGCNPAFTELFGYEEEEVLGKPTIELYASPEEYEAMGEELRERIGDPNFIQTIRYRKKSGEIFPGETNAFYLTDSAGEVIGFIGLVRDVTRRLEAQRALKESEERFRTLYEAAPIGIFRTRSDGEALAVNRAMARILGFDTAEDTARHYHDLGEQLYVRPERRAEFLDLLREQGHVDGFEYEARTRGDETVWLEMYARVAAENDDGTFEIEGFAIDVTEEKRRKQRETELQSQLAQAQKMESIGRLAGGVAHDFNNMLSVILGHVEMAQDRIDPGEPLNQDLRAVREAAESSADLTRQLLAFAREQVATPEVLDLNETIGSMLKMLGRVIGENIDLRWRPANTTWPVRVDPVQIDQVLTNLLVNARDAIDGVGQVSIETATESVDEEYARIHPDARPGDYTVLSVTDTGAGMDEAVAERVFDPFFTTKEAGKGTGLGLATVYGIVHQNDGFIHLYSEPGDGTTFKIYFPRSLEGAAEPRGRLEPDTTEGTETVLVVEDQPAVLSLVEKILGDLGYTVLTAETPAEAVELTEERADTIHLLITDVIMPGLNGQQLAERLAERVDGLRVLFMSGYAEDVIAERGVIEEDVCFIEKPFSRSELSIKVREALDRR